MCVRERKEKQMETNTEQCFMSLDKRYRSIDKYGIQLLSVEKQIYDFIAPREEKKNNKRKIKEYRQNKIDS